MGKSKKKKKNAPIAPVVKDPSPVQNIFQRVYFREPGWKPPKTQRRRHPPSPPPGHAVAMKDDPTKSEIGKYYEKVFGQKIYHRRKNHTSTVSRLRRALPRHDDPRMLSFTKKGKKNRKMGSPSPTHSSFRKIN